MSRKQKAEFLQVFGDESESREGVWVVNQIFHCVPRGRRHEKVSGRQPLFLSGHQPSLKRHRRVPTTAKTFYVILVLNST